MSPLMQGRGLKPIICAVILDSNNVAPHAGAWIETSLAEFVYYLFFVAPHAGAWIETIQARMDSGRHIVAPHAGAWIETSYFTGYH